MIEAMPDGCLLCLDEAYGEFAPFRTLPEWDDTDNHVIRFRTFSKAYGLAGVRAGYAVSSPLIAGVFERIRNHFGMNRVAQAGALAALLTSNTWPRPLPWCRKAGRVLRVLRMPTA